MQLFLFLENIISKRVCASVYVNIKTFSFKIKNKPLLSIQIIEINIIFCMYTLQLHYSMYTLKLKFHILVLLNQFLFII